MTGHATRARKKAVEELVDKFLAWPLPASVCADLCATKQGCPHRSGTTLLSADEARQMIEYLFSAALDLAAQEAVDAERERCARVATELARTEASKNITDTDEESDSRKATAWMMKQVAAEIRQGKPVQTAQEAKIKTRCPSCGNDTLFIGDKGAIACSWLPCKSPSIEHFIKELQAEKEAVKVFQETIRDYVTMRADMAEQGIATEVLSGNVVREARERAALAELQGLQDAVLNYWELPRKAAQPVWSTDKPTVAGWYFFEKADSQEIYLARVTDQDRHMYTVAMDADGLISMGIIMTFVGRWAKIPMPREA